MLFRSPAMSELGTIEKDANDFIWYLNDFISLERARSPSFEVYGILLHLQMSIYVKDDRFELSVHTENTPRERFRVTFQVNTDRHANEELRSGMMDIEGNFYIRRWMPWSEMLSRRLEIFGSFGGLTVRCSLKRGEPIFTDRMSTTSWETEIKSLEDEENDSCIDFGTDKGKAEEKKATSEDSDEEDNATPPESFRDLQKSLKSLLISSENSDVTIKVQGKEFPAHRCILGMRSQVFQSMFKHDMEEKRTGVVDIDDCDPEIFPDFLTHLYTGKTSHISSKNVFGLYSVSDKYGLGYLKGACLEFMKLNITCESFCPTLSLALRHGEQDLVNTAKEFFCGFALKIIETKDWQIFLANNSTAGNELFRAALMTRKPI